VPLLRDRAWRDPAQSAPSNPQIADQIAVNYRKADITPRSAPCSTSPMKVSQEANKVSEADFAEVAGHGFSDDDIWDITAIAAFFALSNRMANHHRDASERRILPDGAAAEIRHRVFKTWRL